MEAHEFLKDLWFRTQQKPYLGDMAHLPSFSELCQSEWSSEFEKCMRARLVQGAFRYGRLGAPNKRIFDRISCALSRLKMYRETGNDEHLVDVANLMLLEYVEGIHPKKHFDSKDDHFHTAEVLGEQIG